MNGRSRRDHGSRERDWATWQGYFASERGLSAFYRFLSRNGRGYVLISMSCGFDLYRWGMC